jgi:hypothetical protein
MANGGNGMTKWVVIGSILQLVMVISGHYNEFIAQNVFALGGMAISLIAGAGYGFGAATRAGAARGGAIVGGSCALIGIVVSYLLGDVPALILLVGTLSSTVTGAVGGLLAGFRSGG